MVGREMEMEGRWDGDGVVKQCGAVWRVTDFSEEAEEEAEEQDFGWRESE